MNKNRSRVLLYGAMREARSIDGFRYPGDLLSQFQQTHYRTCALNTKMKAI